MIQPWSPTAKAELTAVAPLPVTASKVPRSCIGNASEILQKRKKKKIFRSCSDNMSFQHTPHKEGTQILAGPCLVSTGISNEAELNAAPQDKTTRA
jgi:hypothetical protein